MSKQILNLRKTRALFGTYFKKNKIWGQFLKIILWCFVKQKVVWKLEMF